MSVHPVAPARLETGGGWRRTRVRRKRRWPSFIIWKWAGPAQGGWTHCPQKEPLLLRPLHHRRRLTSKSPPLADVRKTPPARKEEQERSHPLALRSGEAERRLVKPRRKGAGGPPPRRPGKPPSGEAVARLERAPGSRLVPGVASRRAARPQVAPPRASGPRRAAAAGGANPIAPGLRRN
jgi:hypothetical protein